MYDVPDYKIYFLFSFSLLNKDNKSIKNRVETITLKILKYTEI